MANVIKGSGFNSDGGGFTRLHVNGVAYTPDEIAAAVKLFEAGRTPTPSKPRYQSREHRSLAWTYPTKAAAHKASAGFVAERKLIGPVTATYHTFEYVAVTGGFIVAIHHPDRPRWTGWLGERADADAS